MRHYHAIYSINPVLAFVIWSTLLCWASGIALGDNPSRNAPDVPTALYTAMPLPAKKVDYRYSVEKKSYMHALEEMHLDKESANASVTFTISPSPEKGWQLDIALSGVPETSTFTSTSHIDKTGNVTNDEQFTGKYRETTSVTLQKVEYIGLSKVIMWEKSQDKKKGKGEAKPKECLISPNEIVTTLLQLPVWAATVRDIPKNSSVNFRWCIKGDPIPMRMIQVNSVDPKVVVYECRRISHTDSTNEGKDVPALVKLLFDKKQFEKGFAMPTTITIQADSLSLSLVNNPSL